MQGEMFYVVRKQKPHKMSREVLVKSYEKTFVTT